MNARIAVVAVLSFAAVACSEVPEVAQDEPPPDTVETETGDVTVSPGTPASPTGAGVEPTTITLEGGQPVGGIEPIVVDLNATVSIVVMADATHQVHIHGYDLMEQVTAETDAEFVFTADIPGTFEIELEDEHRKIAELQVTQ